MAEKQWFILTDCMCSATVERQRASLEHRVPSECILPTEIWLSAASDSSVTTSAHQETLFCSVAPGQCSRRPVAPSRTMDSESTMVGRSFFLSPISPLYSPLQYPQQTVKSVVPAHPVRCSIHWAIHWHPDSRYSASPPCSTLRLTAKIRPPDTSFMLVDTSLVLAIYPPILQSLNPPSNPGDHQCIVSNVLSLFSPSSCGTPSFKSRVRKLISSVSLSLNSGCLQSPSRRCEFMQATSDYRELPDGYRAATDLPGQATRGYQSFGGSYQGLQTGGLGYLATKTTEATRCYDQRFSAPHRIHLDVHSWIGITLALHRTYLRLRKLSDSDAYASLVLQRFTATLGRYQKLRALTLDGFFIGPGRFRDTLASLTQLEELNLSGCNVVGSSRRTLNLRKFTVSGKRATKGERRDPLQLVSPDALSCLKVDGSAVGIDVLQSLAGQTLALLVDLALQLTPPIADIFFTSIVNDGFPRLERLHVTHVSHTTVLLARIALTALPLLQSFKGPLEFLRVFIPDHPVTFICVSPPSIASTATTPDILAALADIAKSSAAPHALELQLQIDGSPEVFAALISLLPELRQLSLQLKEPSRFWPPLVTADLGSPDLSEDEWADSEIDERTVELSDDGSLESVASDVSAALAHDDRVLELPATLKPGYMYGAPMSYRYGKEYAPPDDLVHDEDPELFPGVVEGMCTGRIALSPHLEVLRFGQPSWTTNGAFGTNDHHHALLRLGALNPVLREISFMENGKRKGSGNRVIALSAEERATDAAG
ncbi:hypothetical protein B0H17DRAFT_1143015 [Mycena rosella]|uniref:Uncharacterized protein n=1 Tax=Mycena rosella TaxID=1033263 RepID=A0AAD7CZX0_MYCRO|nr:hypothetical protein B0H17DRAFT_1143015 [Mycena rosella]